MPLGLQVINARYSSGGEGPPQPMVFVHVNKTAGFGSQFTIPNPATIC